MVTKNEQDESSRVEQGTYSIKHLPPPALREGEFTLATWLSADQVIMLRLSVYTGRPAVSTWSPRSKRWTRVTFSSWATLRSELFGAVRGLQGTEEYDLTVKIPSSPSVQSWLLSILHTCFGTPGNTQFSLKTSAVLRVLSAESFRSEPSESSSSEPQRGSNS